MSVPAFRPTGDGRHEFFATSGFRDNNRQMGTPTMMAKRLVTYISDPSTVRARVLEAFGCAPTIEQIRTIRAAFVERRNHQRQRLSIPDWTEGELRRGYITDYVEDPAVPVEKPKVEPQPVTRRSFVGSRLLTVPEVIEAVADHFGMDPDEINGTARAARVVRARNLVFTLLFARGSSYNNVGRKMGRDHTTVRHSIAQFFDRDIAGELSRTGWERFAPEDVRAATSREELAAMVKRA